MKTSSKGLRLGGLGLALVLAGTGLAGVAPAVSPDESGRGVVNVNTATLEQLQQLPGVGETRARALVEARREKGGFRSIDELMAVRGVGKALLEKLRPYVTLEGKTTLRIR